MSDVKHQLVRIERQDGFGIIVIDNPPINAGSHEVRQGLMDAIRAVDADRDLKGGILIGAGKMFMAGSDIREFGGPLQEPQLPAVIAALEQSPKLFIAAIAGAALGGGYELALACDGRIASPEAVVGLPETTLGMIPGAGGTQRLPRLVGRENAIELICAGKRVKAGEAAERRMIDAVATGNLRAEALQFLASIGAKKRRVMEMPVPESDPASLEKAKTAALKAGRSRPHIRAAMEAIERCGRVPAQEGLDAERVEFQRLRVGREAAALRHLFFAERNAFKVPELDGVTERPATAIAIIGGGTMGAGIAATLLGSGQSLTVLENTVEMAKAAEARVRQIMLRQAARGRMTSGELDERMSRLDVTAQKDRIAAADVVIEAVFEDIDVKRDVFAFLGRIARPGAALFTNTSYLSVADIAAASGRPQDVAGMHFFSPAESMKLVEVVRQPGTAPDVLATALYLARRAGKLPVMTRDSFGFIGNRIYSAYRRQCEFMLEEGAQPADIDKALEDFGFAMGPFAVADMSGLDIAWRMRQAAAATRDPAARYVKIPDLLCEMGRFGHKTGVGYYIYPTPGAPRQIDPVVSDLIERASAQAGRERRPIDASEIVERALTAMASEAAFLISEGVVNAPSDIDLVLTHGYGFPKHEGGIWFWVQNQPIADLEAAFERLVAFGGPHFTAGPISALRLEHAARLPKRKAFKIPN